MAGYISRIGSYFNFRDFHIDPNSKLASVGKIAAGVGVAGLALISWKIVAAGALAYSAYKGGQFAYGRFYRRDVRREAREANVQAAAQEEEAIAQPILGGENADGDREERENVDPYQEIIADLRRRQAEIQNRHGKIAFEAVITHPDVGEKGGNIQWLGKMLRKHVKWSRRTGGLSIYFAKAYRKMKACKPKRAEEL